MFAYAMSQAPQWAGRAEPAMPDCYHADLTELLPTGTRAGSWPLDGEGWSFEGEGGFSGRSSGAICTVVRKPSIVSSVCADQRTFGSLVP